MTPITNLTKAEAEGIKLALSHLVAEGKLDAAISLLETSIEFTQTETGGMRMMCPRPSLENTIHAGFYSQGHGESPHSCSERRSRRRHIAYARRTSLQVGVTIRSRRGKEPLLATAASVFLRETP